jgi:hypothetical protein
MKSVMVHWIVFVLVAAVAVSSIGSIIALLWAMNNSTERAACYRVAVTPDACGQPTFLERKMAHYIAHVDL